MKGMFVRMCPFSVVFVAISLSAWTQPGKDWKEATGAADWSPRQWHTSVVHDGKMWLLGGSWAGARM